MVKRFGYYAFIIAISFSFLSSTGIAQQKKYMHAPNALPGVEPEMLTPEYWIARQKDSDKVIMTQEQIKQFNEKNHKRKVDLRDYYGSVNPLKRAFAITQVKGPVMNLLKPLDLPGTLPGDTLRVRFNSNVEWLKSSNFYDGRNCMYSEAMKQEIIEAMNIGSIPDVIKRRYGLVVKHVNVRHYPTDVPGYSNTTYECDMFQATALLIGNPVAVIHQSVDGAFLYIESPISRGWVRAKCIAIGSKKKIRTLTEKKFLMAAESKVPVYSDREFKNFSRYLYFSATMPFEKKKNNGYLVDMPYRQQDGYISIARGYIKPTADVHEGYIPYTKANVIKQIFKLLNQPYGWADQSNKRDCSGTQRVLLRCFGIKTGRHPSFILNSSDHQYFMDSKLSMEEKFAEVAKLDPVITMAGNSGHIVLFLGKAHNGKYYFMHQAGWGYDEGDVHYWVNRVSINSLDHKWYSINSPGCYTTFKP